MSNFKFNHSGSQTLPVSFELGRGGNVPAPLAQVESRGQSFGNTLERWRSRNRQAGFARQIKDELERKMMMRVAEVEESRIDIATGKAKRELLKAASSETAELTRSLLTETEEQTLAIDKDTSGVHLNRIVASKEMRKTAESRGLDVDDLAEVDAVIRHMRAEGLANTMANREVAIADANEKFRKAVSFVERQIGELDL